MPVTSLYRKMYWTKPKLSPRSIWFYSCHCFFIYFQNRLPLLSKMLIRRKIAISCNGSYQIDIVIIWVRWTINVKTAYSRFSGVVIFNMIACFWASARFEMHSICFLCLISTLKIKRDCCLHWFLLAVGQGGLVLYKNSLKDTSFASCVVDVSARWTAWYRWGEKKMKHAWEARKWRRPRKQWCPNRFLYMLYDCTFKSTVQKKFATVPSQVDQ